MRAYRLAPLNVLEQDQRAPRDDYPRDLDSKVKPDCTNRYGQRNAEMSSTIRRTLVTCTEYEGPDGLLNVVERHGISVAVNAWK
jgi:hypothetical protein